MRTLWLSLALSLALSVVMTATLAAADQPLTFEVATVKPGGGYNGVRGGCHGFDSKYGSNEPQAPPPLGRCVITDGRLSHLISIAYNLKAISLIQNAPDWVIGGFDRYTIEAKAEDPAKTTEAQLLEMLQNLLADRFKLKFHWHAIEQPGFRLVVAKNGPKLRAATGDTVQTSFGDVPKPALNGPINLSVKKFSMQALADLLSVIGPGPMVDETSLTGEYDFKLSWNETDGPELKTALQEQLGLRLEAQKVPVQQFVFESAEKPQGN